MAKQSLLFTAQPPGLPALDALRIARGLKEQSAEGAEWPGHAVGIQNRDIFSSTKWDLTSKT